MYLHISAKLGLLPYISKNVRKTLAASHIAPRIEAMRMAMLNRSSHVGSVALLSLITAVIGAVKGNMVRTVKIT